MRISDWSSDVCSSDLETMTLEYKGYTAGPVEFDDDQGLFHGTVAGLRDVVTFAGRSAVELKTAFRESIDDYLDFCAQEGRDPDRPFSGNFPVRTAPELHRKAAMKADRKSTSLTPSH